MNKLTGKVAIHTRLRRQVRVDLGREVQGRIGHSIKSGDLLRSQLYLQGLQIRREMIHGPGSAEAAISWPSEATLRRG